jgi:hypothetical protein
MRESFRSRETIQQEQTAEPFLSRQIPFGVFLGACSMLVIFAGEQIWAWYLQMF